MSKNSIAPRSGKGESHISSCKAWLESSGRSPDFTFPFLDTSPPVACKSGGKVFAAEDAGALVELLAKKSIPHVEHQEQRLWQWWVLLALVVGLLTLEWAGRKLAGLP